MLFLIIFFIICVVVTAFVLKFDKFNDSRSFSYCLFLSIAKNTSHATPVLFSVFPSHNLRGLPSSSPSFAEIESKPQVSLTTLWRDLEKRTQLKEWTYLPKEKAAHRYTNIYCPAATAILMPSPYQGLQYLHANRVGTGVSSKTFIASQAPLPIEQNPFWEFLFYNNSSIVDLSTPASIDPYYPFPEAPLKFPYLTVTLLSSASSLFETYSIQMTGSSLIQKIRRYHFKDWSDFGVITVSQLKQLIATIKELSEENSFLVHCRAGVGRTGTLITALILEEQIAKNTITPTNFSNHLLDLLLLLREHRGPLFVQSFEQFQLLYEYGQSLFSP